MLQPPYTSIRAHRKRLNISLERLAAEADLLPCNLSLIERKRWPDAGTLVRVSAALSRIAIAKGARPVSVADLVAPLDEVRA